MGNIHLVTGYAGKQHVTSADQGSFNASMVGIGDYVLPKGNQFAATVTSSNLITVRDGDILMQGRHIRLNENETVELAIENGQQGYLRNDLIVVRYTKDAVTGIEDANLVVIKGTAAASNPADPAHTSGDIIGNGDTRHDMPLYRVKLNGLEVQLETMFTVASTTPAKLQEQIKTHKHSASDINSGTLATSRLPTVPVSKGGTGKTSVTSGSVLVGNGTGAMTEKTASQMLTHIGAAPKGFGLGERAKVISDANLLDLLADGKCGWFCGVRVANAPVEGWCYFNIISNSATYGVVIAYPFSGDTYRALYDEGNLGNWRKTSVDGHKHTAAEVGAAAANHTHTAKEIGAAAATHKHTVADVTGAAQIATGSYTGNGNSGSSNKNSLTFGFVPKMVTVYKKGDRIRRLNVPDDTESYYYNCFQWFDGMDAIPIVREAKDETERTRFTVSGNTLSWYSGDAVAQCNTAETEYSYVAWG